MKQYFLRKAPALQNIQPNALENLVVDIFAPRFGIQQFMMLVNGEMVCEKRKVPYRKDSKRAMFSVSKSFTAMAVGIAKTEGLVSLEDTVASYFPEFLPAEPMLHMQQMQIKHLLTMTSGLDAAPHNFKRSRPDDIIIDFPYMYEDYKEAGQMDWAKDFVRSYIARAPGERFIYSNECSYMLSRIIYKVTGRTLLEYLDEKLFSKLGIQKPLWQVDSSGGQVGGWGLWLSLEELCVFAELLRNNGNFRGKQIIDAAYIKEATSAQVAVPGAKHRPEKEFGYQIWVLGDGKAYAGIGAFGQMYFVYPALNTTIVMAGGSVQYMKTLHILLNGLPKLFENTDISTAIACEEIYAEETPQGLPSWDMPISMRYTGVSYKFAENPLCIEKLRFLFGTEDAVEVTIDKKSALIPIGYENFAYGELPIIETTDTDVHNAPLFSKVASAGAWVEGRYELKMVFYETPYVHEMCCFFDDYGLQIKNQRNVTFVANINTLLLGVRSV